MNDFLKKIKTRAKADPKRIIFPEGTETRVLEAAKIIEQEGLAIPILLDIKDAKQAHIAGTELLAKGEADALIAGPTANSRDRIRPALQIIKPKDPFHRVSSFFLMLLSPDTNTDAANGGVMLFADCAVNIDPDVQTLADIAIDTARSAEHLGIDPVVAMLSFSTAGSSTDAHVKKIQEAAALARKKAPNLKISDDMQVDTALMDDIGANKAPGSTIAGHANVLIFPDLEAGNIGYKLVERLADATAIGPILQGLNKPVNEVSRGATAEDIVNLAALTSVLLQSNTNS